MPELPEVESIRAHLEISLKGSTVKQIILHEQGGGPRNGEIDDIILGEKPEAILSALVGKQLQRVSRKGKYFWFEMKGESGTFVLFHLGMTGSFIVKDHPIPSYKSFSIDDSWPPKFTKLELEFSNGVRAAFADPRRLGRVIVLKSHPFDCDPVRSLGRDPHLDGIPPAVLMEGLRKYTAPIKAILLDQKKVLCGIGNYLADEVLYQSGIHPQSPSNALTPDMVEMLSQNIEYVISTAVKASANYSLFPEEWMFHQRWSKGKGPTHITTPSGKKEPVVFITAGGRTSAIVSSLQKVLPPPVSSASNPKVKRITQKLSTRKATTNAVGRKRTKKSAVASQEDICAAVSVVSADAAASTASRKRKVEQISKSHSDKPELKSDTREAKAVRRSLRLIQTTK